MIDGRPGRSSTLLRLHAVYACLNTVCVVQIDKSDSTGPIGKPDQWSKSLEQMRDALDAQRRRINLAFHFDPEQRRFSEPRRRR